MKQPNDDKTIELPIEEKRGRSRPALANALTPAERAKRYRANRKANGIKSDAKNTAIEVKYTSQELETRLQTRSIESMRNEIAELKAKNTAKKFAINEYYRIEQENVQLKRQVKLALDEIEWLHSWSRGSR